MRVLILYAHPLADSFNAALHEAVRETLKLNGHDVDDCDLYAEEFDPVLSAEDLRVYRDITANRRRAGEYVNRLARAQGLVLVYPVWNEGFPGILKGFLDRVFLPGVAFQRTSDGKTLPGLRNVERLTAVCTYGAGRFATMLLGDPTRRVVKRLLRSMATHSLQCEYLALYDIDSCSNDKRVGFQKKVERAFARW